MKRAAKILLWTLGSAIAVLMILNGVWYAMNWRTIRHAAEERRLCADRLAQLQHDLRLGTSREDTIRYLDEHRANMVTVLNEGDNLEVVLGRIHEKSWVCNYWDEYAVLSFTAENSSGSTREQLSHITQDAAGQCL